MTIRRVGVVMGGSSGEREVSLRSGEAIARGLETKGYEVQRLVLEPDHNWAQSLRQAQVDAVFLALHGRLGEDGCVQGLCEVMGLPYTGSGVLASALAMDKVKAKELFHQHNVPTPPYYVVRDSDELHNLEELHSSFGYPVVVKPRGEGSSLGMRRANSLAELQQAVSHALEFDDVVLVERYIAAREVHVGVLDGRVLGAIEIAPKKGIYDYQSKYTPGMTEFFMPARLSPTRYRGVLNLAERAVGALGCTGPCRVDLLVTEGENEYVLEVNTLPGMTQTSIFPQIAQSCGYEFADLCEAILHTARLHSSPRRKRAVEVRHESGFQVARAQQPALLAKAV